MTCKAKRRLMLSITVATSLLWCFKVSLNPAMSDRAKIVVKDQSEDGQIERKAGDDPLSRNHSRNLDFTHNRSSSSLEVHLRTTSSQPRNLTGVKGSSSEDPWEEEQKRRKEALARGCIGWKDALPDYTPASFEDMTSLLVDDEHKAIYCYVPKVACTNWKRLWMILTGLVEVEDPLKIKSEIPHLLQKRMSLVGNALFSSQMQRKLETYTKLIVVRHPYERLLSAYLDKFVDPGSAYYKKVFARDIMKMYRGDDSPVPETGDGLTFQEFVRFVGSLSQSRSFDEHWKPMSQLCFPCAIRYDVIAKYETLTEDSERFLRLIGAPEELHFPAASPRNTSTLLEKYFRDITPRQMTALFMQYKKDFEMFGYEASN